MNYVLSFDEIYDLVERIHALGKGEVLVETMTPIYIRAPRDYFRSIAYVKRVVNGGVEGAPGVRLEGYELTYLVWKNKDGLLYFPVADSRQGRTIRIDSSQVFGKRSMAERVELIFGDSREVQVPLVPKSWYKVSTGDR